MVVVVVVVGIIEEVVEITEEGGIILELEGIEGCNVEIVVVVGTMTGVLGIMGGMVVVVTGALLVVEGTTGGLVVVVGSKICA